MERLYGYLMLRLLVDGQYAQFRSMAESKPHHIQPILSLHRLSDEDTKSVGDVFRDYCPYPFEGDHLDPMSGWNWIKLRRDRYVMVQIREDLVRVTELEHWTGRYGLGRAALGICGAVAFAYLIVGVSRLIRELSALL